VAAGSTSLLDSAESVEAPGAVDSWHAASIVASVATRT
jgi:hypothetical protein